MKKYKPTSIILRTLAGILGVAFIIAVLVYLIDVFDGEASQTKFITGGVCVGSIFLEYAIRGKSCIQSYNKKIG